MANCYSVVIDRFYHVKLTMFSEFAFSWHFLLDKAMVYFFLPSCMCELTTQFLRLG